MSHMLLLYTALCGAYPTLIGSNHPMSNPVAVHCEGTTAYVAANRPGLVIFDVSNPAAPAVVGSYVSPGSWTSGLYVVGQAVYVTDRILGLLVVNVTTPSAPTLLGNYTIRSALDVHVIGNTAYVAAGGSKGGLVILDVTTPSAITQLGSLPLDTGATSVFATASLVYVATSGKGGSGAAGLSIVDVSTPSVPVMKGTYATTGEAMDVQVVGTTAYLIDADGLLVIDVATPASPTLMGRCTGAFAGAPGNVLSVVGSAAYVANGGLAVFDVSTPTSPVLQHQIPTPSLFLSGLFALGSVLYVASPLQAYEVSAPLSPTLMGDYSAPGTLYTAAQDVFAVGSLVYLLDGSGQLQIYNTTVPSAPAYVGGCATADYAQTVFVDSVRSIAYIAAARLVLVDVSNPAAPVVRSTSLGQCYGACVVGVVAYIVLSDALGAVDVSNPASPVLLGTRAIPSASGVFAVGTTAYVASTSALTIVDMTTPSSPTIVGACSIPSPSFRVHVAGTTAYVVGYEGAGLQIIDVSKPAAPAVLGSYKSGKVDTMYGVTVSGTTAYVAGEHGLLILDVSDPSSVVVLGQGGRSVAVAVSGNTAYVANVGLYIYNVTPSARQATSCLDSELGAASEEVRSE